ncbi:MAG: ECF-type sigma factor [Fuerstiella sp.]|nr:ECF-type sigma factor [Fuerstiella sp.]
MGKPACENASEFPGTEPEEWHGHGYTCTEAIVSSRGYNAAMRDVTRILSAIEPGDEEASDKLLPLVYQELRKLSP